MAITTAIAYLLGYIFCGRHVLCARLRRANIDAAAGAREEVARIVTQIWARLPKTRIVLRADSGFAGDELMRWCEDNGVDYLFGLARNKRLLRKIEGERAAAAEESGKTGTPTRRFKDFTYATLHSWGRPRLVVGKAEWLKAKQTAPDKEAKGDANPRFVVTSLAAFECQAGYLYEKLYCARGDMENRIGKSHRKIASRSASSIFSPTARRRRP